MQGQRGIIGSLTETLDFDHGSTSGNTITDQQLRWNNNLRNPAEGRLAEFVLSPNHLSNMYVNSASQEQQGLGGWSSVEPSSSGAQNAAAHNEQKMEQGWSSSSGSYAGLGPRLEGRQRESASILSLDRNCQSVQSFNSHAAPQNINLNAAYVVHGSDNCQVRESPGCSKSGVSVNEQTAHANASDAQFLPSGSGGYFVENNDVRAGCSLDGRRQSCKRKAIEGSIGQCSMNESSSLFQHPEINGWPDLPANIDAGSSLSISGPSEQANPRLRLGVSGPPSLSIRDSSMVGRAESSRRNFRLRVNPSNQDSIPTTLFSSGNSVQHSAVPPSRQPSRDLHFVTNDHSFNFGSSTAVDGATSHSQQVVIPAPSLPQNAQSFRWSESSNARPGSSSRLGDRDESNSAGMARNLWEHPVFAPATEIRTSLRNSTVRSVSGGNISAPANAASTSRTGLSSGSHSLAAPTWYSLNTPPRNSRRLAEYVRRALFATPETESGGQSSSNSSLPPGPTASVDGTVLSSGTSNHGHHRAYPRSGSWVGRQGDGVLGLPHPLRALASSGEGRSRMVVSEIRNVLDLMRRGEGLRLEDVMILDQSVFFGVGDIHDRHRDMRMDVDNMSYEELLALEERIGNVSTGLSEETILNRLKQKKFNNTTRTDAETEPCCVCQEEYNEGDAMGALDCGHDFHTECIKQWLMIKNWCPICKTTGLST